MNGRLALVTGASAGIGEAFARLLAAEGFDLALTARRAERLEALAASLRRAHGIEVLVLPADLADPAAPASLLAAIAAQGRSVDVLVNNAGYAVSGAYAETDWAAQARFLEVMVTAVCALAHGVLPAMRAQGYGRIVNVASLAGLLPGAAGATLYAASKAFLVRFSQSLHLELGGTGVQVSALCPGFTYSEFHDVTGSRDQVSRSTPRFLWANADSVARAGWRAVQANRAVCVPGLVNKAIAAGARLAPESLTLALAGRVGRRFRPL